MSINLKRFVDIDIKQHVETRLSGTRDEVILYTSEGSAGTNLLLESLADAVKIKTSMPIAYAYAEVFFNNNGAKLKVIEGVPYANITKELLMALDNKYICVTYAASKDDTEKVYAALETVANNMQPVKMSGENQSSIYGINEKLILSRTAVSTDMTAYANFVVKYSNVVGAEMTMAAYLSRINVYGIDTVYDYMFTQEAIGEEDVSNEVYDELITNNYNVDVKLGGIVRNCGGNCKDGADLVNNYVRIILHQTLTDRLVDVLAQKLKNSSGIAKIYNTITQELENYLTCGYLTRDKIWTDSDLVVTGGNGQQYTIISKGTALTNGYVIKVLPLESLTEQDKALRKAPGIYVVLADQYGIRSITINGEII